MTGKVQMLARKRARKDWIKGRGIEPSKEESREWNTGFNMGWNEAKKLYRGE